MPEHHGETMPLPVGRRCRASPRQRHGRIGSMRFTLALLACPITAPGQFLDMTDAAGIDAPMPGTEMQQAMGYFAGGVGIGDFSGNGCPDAFLVGTGEPNRLFFNQGDGTFAEDPAIAADLVLPNHVCTAVAVADYNNNGWPDIYLGCRGGPGLDGTDRLLVNLHGQGFAAILPKGIDHSDGWSQAAAWGDLTGNGHLDLVVGVHPPSSYDPDDPRHHDKIYLNQGDGTFVNIAPNVDIDPLHGFTLAVKIADIADNGRPDIYIVNDRYKGNVLLRNDGPGCDGWCFTNISSETGADRPADGMGIAIADFDGDGDWDLFYTSTTGGQVLLRNKLAQTGELGFEEYQDEAGIVLHKVGWGAIFFDVNNSGWEDLYVAVAPLQQQGGPETMYDALFHNVSGTFTDISAQSGLALQRRSEAAAWLDFNGDGRVELLIGHLKDRYRLYRNTQHQIGNWIGFELVGGGDINRDAIGALVTVTTADGRVQLRERRAGQSRSATHDHVLHFGLGAHEQAEVTIRWPNGVVENLGQRAAGKYHRRIYRGTETVFSDRFEAVGPAAVRDCS